MISFNTDLADERFEVCKKIKSKNKFDGIETETEKISDKFSINRVKILNSKGEKLLDKKIGNYITIDVNKIDIISLDEINEAIKIIGEELIKLNNNISNNKFSDNTTSKNNIYSKPSINSKVNREKILIVGLGNANTTADSLGPRVAKNINVTRHILKYKPELLEKNAKEVSAISPGVLGTTGIESQELIKEAVKIVKPDLVIAIDALATSNISRLLRTIQICDTGIIPGSGVGNKRKEISKETIGTNVIAIGVPTVLDISAISEKYAKYPLAVMPKDIDDLADNMCKIIAGAINYIIKIKQ